MQFPVSNIKYNITNGACIPEVNPASPTYITVGDGGNIEGLAIGWVFILRMWPFLRLL